MAKPTIMHTNQYTHTSPSGKRVWKLFGCAKRGCDSVNPDYLSFGSVNGKGYCLDHIPLRSRIRLYFQERRA
jgi:hypothetical protein